MVLETRATSRASTDKKVLGQALADVNRQIQFLPQAIWGDSVLVNEGEKSVRHLEGHRRSAEEKLGQPRLTKILGEGFVVGENGKLPRKIARLNLDILLAEKLPDFGQNVLRRDGQAGKGPAKVQQDDMPLVLLGFRLIVRIGRGGRVAKLEDCHGLAAVNAHENVLRILICALSEPAQVLHPLGEFGVALGGEGEAQFGRDRREGGPALLLESAGEENQPDHDRTNEGEQDEIAEGDSA